MLEMVKINMIPATLSGHSGETRVIHGICVSPEELPVMRLFAHRSALWL